MIKYFFFFIYNIMNYKYYREIQSERAIQGNFSSSEILFKWNLGDNTCWNPSKSFVKFRAKLTKGDGTSVDVDFGIAPNMYLCDSFFQQIKQTINSCCVGELNDYVSQCSALRNRMYKSENERESLLSSVNYSQIYLNSRLQQTALDGFINKEGSWRKNIDDQPNINSGIEIAELVNLVNINVRLNDGAGDDRNYDPNNPPENNPYFVFTAVNNGVNLLPDLTKVFSVGETLYITNPVVGEIVAKVAGYRTVFIPGVITSNNNAIIIDQDLNGANIGALGIIIRRHYIYYLQANTAPTRRLNSMELIWKPALGFWNINSWLSGNGDYCLRLNPHTSSELQKYAVEGLYDRLVGNDAENFKFEITQMKMYLYTHVGRQINVSQTFTYEDIYCNSQNLTTNSLTSKIFHLHENNIGLTLAFQDPDVGDDIRYSRSKFVVHGNEQNNLKRYYIMKDGITLPDPIPEVQDNEGIFQITQRYYENYGYSDTFMLDKVETLKQWLDAGLYLHYEYGKGSYKSTGAQVYSQFSALTQPFPQMLLFDHYLLNCNISVSNGKITSVSCM